MFFPKDDDAPARLEALVKKSRASAPPAFTCTRGNTHYFTSFTEPGVRALWKKGGGAEPGGRAGPGSRLCA